MVIESSDIGIPISENSYNSNYLDYLFSFQFAKNLFPSLHNFVALMYPFSIIIIILKSEY